MRVLKRALEGKGRQTFVRYGSSVGKHDGRLGLHENGSRRDQRTKSMDVGDEGSNKRRKKTDLIPEVVSISLDELLQTWTGEDGLADSDGIDDDGS
jgi:hypothetical protein